MRLVRFAADTVVNVSRDDAIISDDSFFTVFLAWRQKEKEKKTKSSFRAFCIRQDKTRREHIKLLYHTKRERGKRQEYLRTVKKHTYKWLKSYLARSILDCLKNIKEVLT